MICEPLLLIMVIYQMFSEIWDVYRIGYKRWWQVLVTFF